MSPRKALRLATRSWCWRGLLGGVAAGVEHEHLRESCGELRTVVDIGANRGQFTLLARACFPAASILAFEPLAEPAAVFARLFAGDPRVQLFRVAIGPQGGEAEMHVSARDDSSSLLPISALQEDVFPGTAAIGTRRVPMARLEQIVAPATIESAALLKLDVQGFELSALRGCDSLLPRFAHVYAELSFVALYDGQALAHEVIDHLHGRGFAITGAYNLVHDRAGRAVQADFLFSRPPASAASATLT